MDKNALFNDILKGPIEAIVKKSAISNEMLPNSTLSRQQSDRFIDMVVDTSSLLKRIRTEKKSYAKGEINRLDLTEIATEGANTTSDNTLTGVSESTIEFDMEKYRSAFDIKSDFLDDNLEGTAARDKILGMFSKRMSIDTEVAALDSDDTLNTGDGQSRLNNLLGVNSGFRKILLGNVPTPQIMDVSGAAPSKKLYHTMKRKIPAKYRTVKPSYVLLVSSAVFDNWVLQWTDRSTDSGDAVLKSGVAPGPFGLTMIEVPLLSETIDYTGAATNEPGVSTGSNRTDIIMTPLSNLSFLMQREITIEWERIPRRDKWECTIHWKGDFLVEEPEMVIYVKNINPDGTAYTG